MAQGFNTKTQEKLNIGLFTACWDGDGDQLNRVQDLLRDGANPLWKYPQFNNVTCLHTAAALGRIEIAKYLVENTSLREHIDIIDDDAMTPCHRAAKLGHLNMTKLLTNYGASVHLRDKNGMTPVDYAIRKKNDHSGMTPVDYAIRKKNDHSTLVKNARATLKIAMKKGAIKIFVVKVLIIGPPGCGKTCTKHLLLGIPPPGMRSSTPIVAKAARAMSLCRLKADGSDEVHWKEMDNETYLDFIAKEVKLLNLNLPPRHRCLPKPTTITPPTDGSTAQQGEDSEEQPSPAIVDTELHTEDEPTTAAESDLSTGEDTAAGTDPSIDEGAFGKIVKNVIRVTVEDHEPSEESRKRKFIHLIDSGGQPSFLSLVPAFVRGCTVNILVNKLPSRLAEHLPFEYVINDKHLRQPTELSQSQLELIEELIRSLSSIMHSRNSYSSSKPRFLIIGTHADKHRQWFTETLDSKCQQIKQKLGKLKDMCINCHPYGDIILPVNTLTKKNRDKISAFIRQKITEAHGSAAEVEIPIRWYVFELEVDSKAKKEDRGVLSLVECFEIGRKLGMGEEEVDAALRYLDEVALCLYFKDAVPHLVFPDPQVILNELTELMNIGIIDLKHISSHYPIQAVEKLRDEGVFNKELVAIVCSKFRVSEDKCSYTVEDFLTILKHLLIVAQVVIEGKEFFFLPAILPLVKKPAFYCEWLATLYLVCRSGVITLGFFPALVVALLSNLEVVRFTLYQKHGDRSQHRNCVQLCCSELGGVVQLLECHAWIEVSYNGDPAVSSHIRQALHKAMSSVCKQRQLDIEKVAFNDGFLCPFAPKCGKNDHPCIVNHRSNWLTCILKPDVGCGKCSDPKKLAWLSGEPAYGSAQSPPSSSISQNYSERTHQLSVHSDTHHLSSEARPVDHSSLYRLLREQSPYKCSGSCEPIDTIAYKLQQHRFPPHKWRVLATCLHMASVVDEIDTDERHVRDKLQALVVCWVSTAGSAEQGNLWETLVEAVYMCEEKVIAIKLAEEMGVAYPGQQ